MSDVQPEFSATEQKYFDTRGATVLAEEAPEQEPSPAPAGGADPTPKAADVPAEDEANVDDDKAEADNPGKFVRHGAFHEERMRRKETEEKFNQFREQTAAERARLEERLNMLAQRFQEPEPVITDPNERLARVEQTLQQRLQQEEQQRQAQQNERAFVSAIERSEAEFAQDTPDYEAAVEYARNDRLAYYVALGFNQQEAANIVYQDTLRLAEDSFRRGISPAKRFYEYAKARGYGKQAEPAPKEQDPADKLRTIAAGQAAGKSLSTAPGTSQAALTLQALADMPQDEFDRIDDKTWRKMMGGR